MGKDLTKRMTNKEIIEGFLNNDKKIILQVYNRLFPKIKKWVFSYNGDEDNARDATWKAFAIFRQKCIKMSTEINNSEAYIMRIAQNNWYKQIIKQREDMMTYRIRHGKTETDKAIDEITVDWQLQNDKEEAIRQFQNQLKKLSILCQQLILLKYQHGLPHEDIAIRYETSISVSRKRLSRCLKRLALVMEEEGFTQELAQYYAGVDTYVQKHLNKKK